ncbi:2,3-diaminopropionate biosynthesis protein SbnB [Streptomyces sp. NPDC005209]|uniref:2,3-diaminopropionate biosynthesis protein SbnB n=1 Tax=Streptomyces sp. NPDC005209 TaxID=3156715 RepID=UPI0033AB13B6
MPSSSSVPEFCVIPGAQVQDALASATDEVLPLVENVYRMHAEGDALNPPSYFFHPDGTRSSRIITLPASLRGDQPVSGMKWIASYPANLGLGLPRASGVVILNDPRTGYPFACMEGSVISATRTAASAVLAATALSGTRPRPATIGFVGCGMISRYIQQWFVNAGWRFTHTRLFDADGDRARRLGSHLEKADAAGTVSVSDSLDALVRDVELVVFATTASAPHVDAPEAFSHHPVVLHVSLRDLSPAVVSRSFNVVDDIDHCLTAGTSLELTEQQTGHRDFVSGTLHDVLSGRLEVPGDETVVFSPFGLGVLDLALAHLVHRRLTEAGDIRPVPDFFSELDRPDEGRD